ncbi:hypothetical protein HYX07_00545 [Candidatus Woesearchaeota archaeon]|nr:hypothetical protein [Candidatus Woesearchaeota archaeon]
MKPNSINFNKKSELKSIAIAAIILSLIALLSTIAFAIPNSLTLQGKLTDLAGASQVGTFNFTFKIYDNVTGGNELWAVINQSVTTDANGIYDIILSGLNLTFADQYYLGIAVQGENESVPRINLTSSPYSFRANTSEALNPNASYFVRNLSVSGNATIGDGTTTLTISTQGFNLTTIGNVFIGMNLSVAGNTVFVDGLNQRVGIGTTSPNYLLQTASGTDGRSVNLSNLVYVNSSSGNVGIGLNNPNATLHILGSSTATMGQIGDGTNKPALHITGGGSGASDIVSMNNIDGNRVFTLWGNSQLGIGTKKPGGYLDVSPLGGTIPALLVNQSQSGDLIQAQSSAGTVYFIVKNSGSVGIGTTAPNKLLEVNVTAPSTGIATNGTLYAPIINTTRSDNLTISSAAGSVIIRLG